MRSHIQIKWLLTIYIVMWQKNCISKNILKTDFVLANNTWLQQLVLELVTACILDLARGMPRDKLFHLCYAHLLSLSPVILAQLPPTMPKLCSPEALKRTPTASNDSLCSWKVILGQCEPPTLPKGQYLVTAFYDCGKLVAHFWCKMLKTMTKLLMYGL